MPNKVPVFHFQNLLDLVDCNTLFGFNRINDCKSKQYKNLRFETIVEVDSIRK